MEGLRFDMRPMDPTTCGVLFSDATAVRRANRWLLAAAAQSRPVSADGLRFRLVHVHIGRGLLPCGFGTGLHTHAEIQLEHVLFGKVDLAVGEDQPCALAAGDMALLPPILAHGLHVRAPTGLLGALVEVTGNESEAFHTHCARLCRDGQHQVSPFATEWAEQMLRTSTEAELSAWSLERVAELLRLWLQAALEPRLRSFQATPDVAPHDQRQALLDRAVAFIRANVERPIRAEDVARDLALSKRHLNRMFQRAFSETVSQSITRHRLREARRLLAEDPRLQVKEVAAAMGYETAAYFSYCFRRQFGYPPSGVSRTETTCP